MSAFLFRDATPADKEEVLAFTADTWEGGDYIQWVFDEWVADKKGRFLVAVDRATGKLAGIDKLSMLSPAEAWFEGIRVNPKFRGQGLSGLMQRHMIEQARSLGASTVRMITALDNRPIHRIAYRDGFGMRFTVRHWDAHPHADRAPLAAPSPMLRRATSGEGPTLHDWWTRTVSFTAVEGLLDRGWSFSSTSPEEWTKFAHEGRLFVVEDWNPEDLSSPPGFALVNVDTNSEGQRVWHLAAFGGTPEDLPGVAGAILRLAEVEGVRSVGGLLPDTLPHYRALEKAGFSRGTWHSFALFELRLD